MDGSSDVHCVELQGPRGTMALAGVKRNKGRCRTVQSPKLITPGLLQEWADPCLAGTNSSAPQTGALRGSLQPQPLHAACSAKTTVQTCASACGPAAWSSWQAATCHTNALQHSVVLKHAVCQYFGEIFISRGAVLLISPTSIVNVRCRIADI